MSIFFLTKDLSIAPYTGEVWSDNDDSDGKRTFFYLQLSSDI